jgi:hypothetical protein
VNRTPPSEDDSLRAWVSRYSLLNDHPPERAEATCSLLGFLIQRAVDQSSPDVQVLTIIEAVTLLAQEHPEWPDLGAQATWSEWLTWEQEQAG